MPIETIAVIGSGLMGRGIAYASLTGGFRTILHDVAADALDRACAQIRRDLDEAIARGKLTPADAAAALKRLEPEQELGAAACDADFVIEAVPEDIALKLRTFERLDQRCGEQVVLATNTSGLSITEIAAATRRPARVVGMHFFNPVPKMKLVEVVRALDTSADTVGITVDVARRMGKETVIVKESAGFITSRINAMIGNEAFLMLEAGVASARDIDKALKLGLNHPMGPFELADLIGLDTCLAISEVLHAELGDDKYRPAPLLRQYVAAGWLGRKSGRGFYKY
jgi:3-hydroxybutyryl-CoA dehydrogenase